MLNDLFYSVGNCLHEMDSSPIISREYLYDADADASVHRCAAAVSRTLTT